jgi:hypothetical protein
MKKGIDFGFLILPGSTKGGILLRPKPSRIIGIIGAGNFMIPDIAKRFFWISREIRLLIRGEFHLISIIFGQYVARVFYEINVK